MKQIFLTLLLFTGLAQVAVAQFDIPPKPDKQTSLYDYANLLNKSQASNLEQKLIRYSDSTSTQIVIAIIDSSKGEDLALLGAKWGQKWGIGQKKEDNGILILMAHKDRRIDINTGYGIEYRMSDTDTERVINRIIIPNFKKGNYYVGLDQGTDAIFQHLNGEFVETRDCSNQEFPWQLILFFVMILIFIILSASRNNRGNNSGNGGTPSLLDIIILSNMGRGGFGGGSGGFGGGGFGGGGAGGSW